MSRIGVIGLKLYAKRLEHDLGAYFPEHRVKAYDTYDNKVDKLKYAADVLRMDGVFSINGDNFESNAFTWAMKNKVKLTLNWSGSDVLRATENFKTGRVNQALVDYAYHTCQTAWIQRELKAINIDAEILQFQHFPVSGGDELPKEFKVISRVAQGKGDFYGMKELIALAEAFPDIEFNLVGIDSYEGRIPNNIHLLGWVDDMEAVYAEHIVAIRYPYHDGLSPVVLESLARAKHVLYKYEVEAVRHCPSLEHLKNNLRALYEEFKQGELGLNQAGRHYLRREFEKDVVFPKLLKTILHH